MANGYEKNISVMAFLIEPVVGVRELKWVYLEIVYFQNCVVSRDNEYLIDSLFVELKNLTGF